MLYLKKFQTTSLYEQYINGSDAILPNVSLCDDTNSVHYNPYIPPYSGFCELTLSDGTVVEIEGSGTLTQTQVSRYSGDAVGARIGTLCTSIGEYTFSNCTSLTSTTIENTVITLNEGAFFVCSSLTNVTIPNSVTSIGDSAFEECSSLVNIVIPNTVTSIGNSAFYACGGLTSVTIPSDVTSIGESAFGSCSSLTIIEIPRGVTSIGNYAFQDCTSLTSITVDANNTVYDSRNNCNAIIETETNTLIQGCKTTVIPSSVTSIGNGAFQNCTNLTSIEIPSSVTSIGNGAFQSCSGLTTIDIPNSVTSIGDQAFIECHGLISATIGRGVTSIGINVFADCSGLTSITSLATTAPTISNFTFYNVKTDGTLSVPSGASGYDAWMSTANYYLGKYNWAKVEQ